MPVSTIMMMAWGSNNHNENGGKDFEPSYADVIEIQLYLYSLKNMIEIAKL